MDDESKKYFTELAGLGADNKKFLLKAIETEQRIDFPKSLHNFKGKVLKGKNYEGKNSARILLEKLNKDKEDDSNMASYFISNTFKFWRMYSQT